MKNKNNYSFSKILCLFIALIILSSCKNAVVYEPNKYNFNSPEYFKGLNLANQFSICASLFAPNEEIEYQANLQCSKINKVAEFVDKKYFYTCYLTKPISYNYICVDHSK